MKKLTCIASLRGQELRRNKDEVEDVDDNDVD
jgi:hypothetical protein